MIVAALAAGASAVVSGTATDANKDGYDLLKALIRRRFTGREDARRELEADQTEPGIWQTRIGQDLRASGAATDQQILAAARELLAATDPGQATKMTTRRNLAYLQGQAGDSSGAVAALERLLQDSLRVLGPDHPDTLTTRRNLAYWRGQAGDPGGAVAALERLLQDSLRVLGPDHPDTLTTRRNLACWRGYAGDPGGAATAFKRLLRDERRVLGRDHPVTLNAHLNLAYWRRQARDPDGAVTAYEYVLDDQLRVPGHDRTDTLTTRNNIACRQVLAARHWAGRVLSRLYPRAVARLLTRTRRIH